MHAPYGEEYSQIIDKELATDRKNELLKQTKIVLLGCDFSGKIELYETIRQQFINDEKTDVINESSNLLFSYRNYSENIETIYFDAQNSRFNLTIVNGQSYTEINKWIHCFEFSSIVIFTVSIACYDISITDSLEELIIWYINNICNHVKHVSEDVIDMICSYCSIDVVRNQMAEQIELFDTIVNCKFLDNVRIILLFTEENLFKEKLNMMSITMCSSFKDYKGKPNSYDESVEFIRNKFLSLNMKRSKTIGNMTIDANECNDIELLMKTIANYGKV